MSPGRPRFFFSFFLLFAARVLVFRSRMAESAQPGNSAGARCAENVVKEEAG